MHLNIEPPACCAAGLETQHGRPTWQNPLCLCGICRHARCQNLFRGKGAAAQGTSHRSGVSTTSAPSVPVLESTLGGRLTTVGACYAYVYSWRLSGPAPSSRPRPRRRRRQPPQSKLVLPQTGACRSVLELPPRRALLYVPG
jgi:hypothetical protein